MRRIATLAATTVLMMPATLAVCSLVLAACSVDSIVHPGGPLSSSGRIAGSRNLQPGQVETVLSLTPVTDLPEGIAVDHQGNLFIGNRRLSGALRVSEIIEITPDDVVSVVATLDPGAPDFFAAGVLGLAVDAQDNLYAALATSNPETHGVWRIARRGGITRLAGSERMNTPNALTFDARGNLYVTDSGDGAVWRFPPSMPGTPWLRNPLLAPDPNFGVGANGIAFVPPSTLFVANTDQGLVARIPIEQGGEAGEPAIAAAGFQLLTVDGLVADAEGGLHAVIAGSGIFGTDPVVRLDPATGLIESSTTESLRFDFPTSLAFGRGLRDHQSVYVINAGLFPEDRPNAAPGVERVRLDVPGMPAH